jgi:hypothetical protein
MAEIEQFFNCSPYTLGGRVSAASAHLDRRESEDAAIVKAEVRGLRCEDCSLPLSPEPSRMDLGRGTPDQILF